MQRVLNSAAGEEFKQYIETNNSFKTKYKITTKPGIYLYKSVTTNKVVYVGQAANLSDRISSHVTRPYLVGDREYDSHLHRAIRKHGPQAYILELAYVQENYDKSDLDRVEIELIKKYNTYTDDDCYNSTIGGDGFGYGRNILKPDKPEDMKLLNDIREYLLAAAKSGKYLTLETVADAFDDERITKNLVARINAGTGCYYSPKYNGPIDARTAIYSFPAHGAYNVKKSSNQDMLSIVAMVDINANEPYTIDDVLVDHNDIPLLFTSEANLCKYIKETYSIPTIDSRVIHNMLTGKRAVHSALANICKFTRIDVPIDTIDNIRMNEHAILSNIEEITLYAKAVQLTSVTTRDVLVFKKSFSAAKYLIAIGTLDGIPNNYVSAINKACTNEDVIFGYKCRHIALPYKEYFKLD